MITLKCTNNICNCSYLVSEKELIEYPDYHSHCFICGSQLKITKESLEEMVMKDLYKRAEEYINEWVQKLGLEGCIELVERNREQVVYRIYREILEKKGLKLK